MPTRGGAMHHANPKKAQGGKKSDHPAGKMDGRKTKGLKKPPSTRGP